MEKTNLFKIVLPAEITKSSDGEWRIRGLASTSTRDRQGEVILQDGIDASPIDEGRGILNWDHHRDPENIVGTLDSYKKSAQGLVVEGRLFQKHDKAKAIYQIMSSLNKGDRGKMGMSVEGAIIERAGKDGKIIKKCKINAVALTMNPVNTDSYVDLAKSLNTSEIEFDATKEGIVEESHKEEPIFTATQVLQIVEKALTAGAGYTKAPTERSGGEALSRESIDDKIKQQNLASIIDEDENSPTKKENPKKKKLKPLTKALYKASLVELFENIQKLYPNTPKDTLWEAVKDRLNESFPEINN